MYSRCYKTLEVGKLIVNNMLDISLENIKSYF